jgi:hypothetical protein
MNEGMKSQQMSLHRENLIWDVRASHHECQRFSSTVTDAKSIHKKEGVNDYKRGKRLCLH